MEFTLKNGFSLTVGDDRIDVRGGGYRLFSFPVSTPCDAYLPNCSVAEDCDTGLTFLGAREEDGCTALAWTAESSLYRKKEYTVRVYDTYFTYRVRVLGEAELERVRFFGGGEGTKYFVSGYFDCQADYHTEQTAHYLVGHERALQPYLFSPPPYVVPFWNEFNDKIVSVGIADRPGHNHYFRFTPSYEKPRKMWFDVPYYGHDAVRGEWISPTVRVSFGDDEWREIEKYCRWAETEFGYPVRAAGETPAWWKKPIFCGWNEQYNLRQAKRASGEFADTKALSTQKNYTEMLARIDRVGLRPGTVVIDDMWQTDYGRNEVDTAKWPDLRAFADEQHRKDRRVLLWWRLWSPDGLPGDECIVSDGCAVAADPTSPAYRRRIARIVRTLLSDSPGCMNCDGFKLDYIYRLPPLGDRAKPRDPTVYGLELLRIYYKTIYDEAKKVKPDALIDTSIAHPYFADVFDVIRLHDYSAIQRSTVSMMEFRAKTVRCAFPGALIDTDGANSFTGDAQEVLFHNERACRVGIPALYALSNLSDGDLLEIRKEWELYVAEKNKKPL
ncbi:MAG: hypothetical protein IJK23_03350 [Clostridia bacterium]|nr:hypothetical protein [Clostridia bacterium]